MSRGMAVTLLALVALVLVSALGVVHAKFDSRKLFVELQELTRERDDIDVQWGKLQLEFAALGTHGRVERLASEKLGMVLPESGAVVVIRRDDGR